MNAPAAVNGPAVPATIEHRPQLAPLVAGSRPKPIVPTDMDQVWRFANIVVKSGMAPKGMEKAEAITVAIMHGLEVGLTPLMALQRIAVINGRPSIWGDAAIGLVRASGLCEYVQELISGEGDHMVAICRAKRKGEKEPIERSFSVGDAKKAGLWGKAGPWQQYSKRMLQMRARAFTLRDLFADVLGGLYIAEELEGLEEDHQIKDVTPRPVVKAKDRPELPAAIPARTTVQSEPIEELELSETQIAPPPSSKKPLPPPAKARKPTQDTSDIPMELRRNAPPADQPEAFREWMVVQLGNIKTTDDVGKLWDGHVAPNIENEQILPPDLDDLTAMFAERQTEIANR